MNALFGLWQMDGAPLDPTAFSQMESSLDFWHSETAAQWQGESIRLGCLPGATDQPDDAQVVYNQATGLALIASARLIRRAELAAELSFHSTDLSILSDTDLILAAWLRWGQECVHHLEGDWHFALWDAPARRLFLARDQHGTSSLYYHQSSGLFAFSSIQKPLLALTQIPQQPNLIRIAQILGDVLGDGSETGYSHIQRLPPAHHLTVDGSGLRVARYWHPEQLTELHLADDGAYVEAFLDHYRAAVVSRLARTGNTGLMLSGGLDSGSLAVLAGAALAERDETLAAFTSIPVGKPAKDLMGGGPLNEGPLAAAVAEAVGNIDLTPIDAADTSPLAGIERMLWVHDEPAYPAGNSYWLAAIYAAAREAGVTTLLAGTAGNDTVSWRGAPPHLLRLLLKRGLGAFVDGVRSLRARTGLSTRALLWTGLAKPLLRDTRARVPWPGVFGQTDWDSLNPIHSDFAQRPEIAAALTDDKNSTAPTFPEERGWAAWRLNEPGRWLPPTFHFQDGGAAGLDVLDPTGDRRLMEFCLTVPTSQYHSGVEDRWLIRRAMAGRLPDQIRLTHQRARQSADTVSRLHTHRDEMDALLPRLAAHPLASEVLDMPRLLAVMEQIGQKPQSVNHYTASALLLRGVMAGLFLERF